MIRSLWIAKTGLDAQQTQLDVISNNLANVSTNGFKRSRAVFEDLLYQNMKTPGSPTSSQTNSPTGLQVGTGVRPVAAARIHTQGNLQQTGNPMDLAIAGQGFFQIQLPDGTTAYSRDGNFHVDQNGQMVNSNGNPLSPAITIPANALSVNIGQDGTVTATVSGQTAPATLGQVQVASFTNPAGLESRGQNLYVETVASGSPTASAPGTNGLGVLNQGYVETSNVNVVEELVSMIQTQRAYEINSKAVTVSDQMLQKLAQL
ncbi:flagellar basal-body rod protein FlgG [Betaproteobacteria bacterium GR16-43]|nr:flagellar basal-body rod protein FlgG [Betaproteobacteria bacterium GR16-43]